MIFSIEGSKAVSNLYAMFSCERKGDVAGVLCVLRVSQDSRCVDSLCVEVFCQKIIK